MINSTDSLVPRTTGLPARIAGSSTMRCSTAAILLLRRDRGRPRMLLDLLQLRFEAAPEDAVDAVKIEVDDRRDVERQELRHAQAADHRDAERLAQLGAGAGAERDRQRAEDRREGGHHD